MIIPINEVKEYLLSLQNMICETFSLLEKEKFPEDRWQHHQGGGGISRVLTDGSVIEKGGVNFSHILGGDLPPAATEKRPELKGLAFQALGVSAVIHPVNPYVPTSHMNVRFFLAENNVFWFGGGFDLTPYYGFAEDCVLWHEFAKKACEPFGKEVYPTFKKWCDDYFYLKHRQEPRGIGGLFFDDLHEWGFEQCFAFIKNIGKYYLEAYKIILEKRKNISYTQREKDFQKYRRGRYVEFNLLYDRGTLFGLQTSGRTESILMSLPPEVVWKYQWHPDPGSAEAELYDKFLKPRNWV